ncbi:MAG: hypothetical protein JSU08_11535 [Acidobacteria bacterium]|nr:hypothetical protein [Acidobacteriota bacterium]
MKIEGNRPNIDASLAAQDTARISANQSKEQSKRAGGDAFTVSPELALANKAIDEASQPISVRPDAVARGRALLESGKLGSDAQALADTLIQRMLNNEV